MNETTEEIEALQRLFDKSISSSGRHLTGIITDQRRLSARQVVAALTGMKVLVVATVTAAGEPRTSCVDGHFLHATWMFSSAENAHKARDLKARRACSATHVDGEKMAVFTHGYVRYITPDDSRFQPFEEHFIAHYGSSPRDWTPHPVFFDLQPRWMVAYAMNPAQFPAA